MIVQCMVSSFKAQILLGVHDFRPSAQSGASVFKMALYTSSATLNANTTAYTSSNEVTGTGYTAGGAALTNLGVSTYDADTTTGVGYLSFDTFTIPNSTITARGALIYNSTPAAHDNSYAVLTNPAVCVVRFGTAKGWSASAFSVIFPSNTYSAAILRIE